MDYYIDLSSHSFAPERGVNARFNSFMKLVKKVREKVNIEQHVDRIEDDFKSLESYFIGFEDTSLIYKKRFFNIRFLLSKLLERYGIDYKNSGLKGPKKNNVFDYYNLAKKSLYCARCSTLQYHCEECETYEEWEWRKVDRDGTKECERLEKKWEEFHYQQGEGERYRLEQIQKLDDDYLDRQGRRRIYLQQDYEHIEDDESLRKR